MHKSSIENQGNLAKPMLGDVYRDVLRLFQGTDPLREAMQQPFFQDEFVIATDAHKLVCFKKELLKNIDFESHPKAPNALAVIPTVECCRSGGLIAQNPIKALTLNNGKMFFKHVRPHFGNTMLAVRASRVTN